MSAAEQRRTYPGCSPLPPAARDYLAAYDAYLAAPREQRDQLLVRKLCDAALDELIGQTPAVADADGRPDSG